MVYHGGIGSRNVEILKQAQYAPMRVENQIAIIFCGSRNLLKNIPVAKIKAFEVEFLNKMEHLHKAVLQNLKDGKLLDEDIKIIEQLAKETAVNFEESK